MKPSLDIQAAILRIATQRGSQKSTCPSEIARMLFPNDWRNHMKDVVNEAIQLHHDGRVLITQKSKPVDIDHIKGPVRIKLL
ncbi:hypothetical protein GCM10022246_08760 [Pedobacter ginsengiterrae]|uniref:DUF3253 domain-containing protein n=1 Tax=Pedobacter ginsengiterrae TaxID=871696 RepID=A0ABP7NZG6_9SPHI